MTQGIFVPGNGGLSRRGLLKFGGAATLGVMGASLLTACSDDASTTASGPQKKGGVLKVGFAAMGATSSLDPCRGAHLIGDTARHISLFSKLTHYVDGKLENNVAEEISADPGGKFWTIRLRKGVLFHNGKELDSDDLIFSLRRQTEKESVNASSLSAIDRNNLQKIDKYTVKVPTNEPFAMMRESLARYAGIVMPVGFDPKNPVGTGPFKLKSYTAGRETQLTRFDDYFGDVAFVDEVHLIEFADVTARLNALIGGQIQATHDLSPSQLTTVAGSPGIRMLSNESPVWSPLIMRTDSPQFRDERVRQAMRLIPDRKQLVDVALGGHGTMGNDVFGRFDDAYIGDDIPQREQDIDQAKFLLKQAGVPDLKLVLSTTDVATGVVEASTLFAEQAKMAGVTVEVDKISLGDYFGPKWSSYHFGVDTWTTGDYFYPANYALAPGNTFNESGWYDKEWGTIWKSAVKEFDTAKRTELFRDLQRIDHERGGYIVWSFANYTDAVSNNTVGWPEGGRFTTALADWAFNKVSIA